MSSALSADQREAIAIRATHPYSFRSGTWADILTTVESYGRPCYLVRFSDGAVDWWPVDDAVAGYEFAAEAS